jgi:hypothetical protein
MPLIQSSVLFLSLWSSGKIEQEIFRRRGREKENERSRAKQNYDVKDSMKRYRA